MLAYFVAHEADHRGQIVLIARQPGQRLARATTDGLWEWSHPESATVSARIHSILPRIAIGSVLVVPVAGFMLYRSWTRVYEVPRGGDVFTFLRGTWAWSTSDTACRANPFRIAFSPDHRAMTITSKHSYKRWNGAVDSIGYYEVLQTTRSSIRAVLRGETRVTVDSEPIVWDLVLRSPNTFTWHRTDLAGWLHTPLIRRCPTAFTGVP